VKTNLKPLARDTSIEAETLLFDHYGSLEVHEKTEIIADLNGQMDRIALVGIRERHPDASEREQHLRLAALKYGRELMVKAFGWDPELQGW
jgi:hypothetical protein